MPIPINGTKYLHKKFKKMAAILSDDCAASVVEAVDKRAAHISAGEQLPQQPPCPLPAAPKTSPDVRVAASPVAAAAPQSSLPESAPTAVLCATRVEPAYLSPPLKLHHKQPHSRLPTANGLLVVADDQLTAGQPPSRLSTAFAAKTNPTAFSSAFCNGRASGVSVPASVPVAMAAVAPLVTPPIASATAAFLTAGHTSLASEDEADAPAAAGRHACPYCKLVCNKPSVLQKHIRAHTNERPFPCPPCGFAFKTSSNLYKHQRSRAHNQKMEECGVDGKTVAPGPTTTTAMVAVGGNSLAGSRCSSVSGGSLVEEELMMCCDEEDDSQASSRDADASSESESSGSGGSNGKVAQPKKSSIYKPKFHKAAIYIQSNPLVPATSLLSAAGEHLAGAGSLNKFGLQLKIPAGAGGGSRSLPSTPSPFSGSSPSPEFLQQHISKLISENRAIVETNDPLWSKKFYSRTNKESAISAATVVVSCSSVADAMLSAALPKKKVTTAVAVTAATATTPSAVVEERLANESKLAHALLQPKVAKSISMNNVNAEESQPLNLTMCKYAGPSKSVERVPDVAAPTEIVEEMPIISVSQKPAQVRCF